MDIKKLRDNIDNIDSKIIDLFCERMAIAGDVAKYKLEMNLPVRNPSREREILNRITENLDDLHANYAKTLFTSLFDISSSYQNRLMSKASPLAGKIREAIDNTPKQMPKRAVVACQGAEGAYSQLVCDKLFPLPSIMYLTSFESVFQAVDQNLCKYGILPIENSLHGSVTEVYDLMKKYKFYIAKSIRLNINHVLLAKKGAKLSDIKEIYSHEQAIGQCSEFISGLKNVKINYVSNTAMAAKMIAESGRSDLAAISSGNCAALYSLYEIESNIQNNDNNYTRFICISKELEIYPGADTISIMLNVSHRPGSLYNLISKFAVLGLNLTKLESRPIPGRDFEFMFYFDMDAKVYSDDVLSLISELENGPEPFVFLGAYSKIA